MAFLDYLKDHIKEIKCQTEINGKSAPLSNDDIKAAHFALMPECGINPFFYYVPAEGKIILTENTSFEEVEKSYDKVLEETTKELGVDARKLEAWFSSCSDIVWKEVERMEATGWIKFHCGIESVYDAICASRVFYDNGFDFEKLIWIEKDKLPIGYDIEHPIVITESRNYVKIEHVVAEAIFNLKGLSYKPTRQQLMMLGDKQIDKLCFKVSPEDSDGDELVELYFDITAGFATFDDWN